ncbi:LysR family transcriptional regulator [Clostridium sp. YIM B02506]|uniref:LysR family transcriptional regulator n=1 Tax=Clostridium sp. YIM B02506 TaxID=2910680 RepID=UPI001EEDEFE5|nr:LysR family transcriptional regulator [Clostridium sp. YIM B02506]
MDVRILKYFLAVAQEESITKAAEVLRTTQPNLSRQLTELEEEVGRKLFERGSRKITLTEEGMFLRKRAKEIIELVERTETALSSFDEMVSGVVHIGAAETHAMRLIADAMLSLRETHPQIQYNIFSGSTIEVTDQLNKGLLDFGVLVAPVDLQKYDYLKLPINDIFGVLMQKDSPLAKLNSISPDDIKNQPVLCAHQQVDGNVLSGWLGDDSKNLNIVSTFNLITTPAMMVEAGLGYAFTFDKLVNTSGDSNLCFRPLEPKVETGLYLVWKKYQIFTKAAKMFLEEIQQSLF